MNEVIETNRLNIRPSNFNDCEVFQKWSLW